MSDEIYVGDSGTQLLIDMGEDLSEAVSVVVKARKPDGTEEDWAGEVYQPVDGLMQYIRVALTTSMIDAAGTYKLQPYITFASWSGYGTTCTISVLRTFK